MLRATGNRLNLLFSFKTSDTREYREHENRTAKGMTEVQLGEKSEEARMDGVMGYNAIPGEKVKSNNSPRPNPRQPRMPVKKHSGPKLDHRVSPEGLYSLCWDP